MDEVQAVPPPALDAGGNTTAVIVAAVSDEGQSSDSAMSTGPGLVHVGAVEVPKGSPAVAGLSGSLSPFTLAVPLPGWVLPLASAGGGPTWSEHILAAWGHLTAVSSEPSFVAAVAGRLLLSQVGSERQDCYVDELTSDLGPQGPGVVLLLGEPGDTPRRADLAGSRAAGESPVHQADLDRFFALSADDSIFQPEDE
jgi:hypothetical protein